MANILAVDDDTAILSMIENVLVINVISLLLYFFFFFGAADTKLIAVISVFVPVHLYIHIINNPFCLSFILVFAFSISYLALVVDSIRLRIKTGKHIDAKSLAKKYCTFLYRYFCIVSYVTLFNQVLYLLPIKNQLAFYISMIISLSVALLVNRLRILQRIWIVIPIAIAGIIFKLIVGIDLFNIQLLINYGIVLLMSLAQLLIQDYNYETIDAKDIKRGMILSLQTTLLFENSKIEGLPGLSKEDLRSRLTEEEANSVIKWSSSAKGREKIIIVRKMPFAIFISLGVVVFLICGVCQ